MAVADSVEGASIASDAALCGVAAAFLRGFFSGTARQRSRRLAKAPLRAIQVAALRHPDPFTRKECLFFLDHYANEPRHALARVHQLKAGSAQYR